MAKNKQSNLSSLKSKKRKEEHLHLALTQKNYMIIGVGIVVIILGYILMAENSVDGFLPTVIAPILLVFGYCIVVPLGILYKGNKDSDAPLEKISEGTAKSTNNIKTT